MKSNYLGQHFLISSVIVESIIFAANIQKNDIVLEIGTGTGVLLPLLCKKAKKVISIELDTRLYTSTKFNFSHLDNLILKNEDGFKNNYKFTIFVSNIPYSKSRKAMEWLMQKKFSHAIIMVQKEFANKLLMYKNRKAVSVLVDHALRIECIMNVNRRYFFPLPSVDSMLIKLTQKKTVSKNLIETINRIFSYKRKYLHNITKKFKFNGSDQKYTKYTRLENLNSDEIISIAKQIG